MERTGYEKGRKKKAGAFKRLFSNILKPFQKKRKESKGGDLEGRM